MNRQPSGQAPSPPGISRRRLLQLGGLAATAPLLAGCNYSDAFVQADEAQQKRDGDIEVIYWHMWTADWKILIDSLVAEFNASHPGIFVKALSVTGDPNAKFLAARAGGDPPDVMTQWNQVIASWSQMGALRAMDGFPSAAEIKGWLYPTVANIGTYDGKLTAMPFSMNSFRLFVNTGLMKQVGLDPAQLPTTIQELDAIQEGMWAFNDRGFIERIGFMPGGLTQWAPSFDGQWADANGNPTATYENNVRVLEWFRTYAEKYDPNRVAAFNQSMTSNVNSAWPFMTDRLGFARDGMWRLIDLQSYAPDVEYTVIDLPYPEGYGKEQACWVNGNYNIIPTDSAHPDEAWEFIKWLTGYQNEEWAAQMLVKGGWIPASPKITEQPAYQAYMDEIPERRGYVELFNSPNTQITPLLPAQQYYWDRLATAEERVLRLIDTPLSALETAQEEIERELGKVVKQ